MEFRPQLPQNIQKPPFPIMLLGEAPGAEEEKFGKPFIGRSGQLLRKSLNEIEIDPDNLYVSNVFWERPIDNDVGQFFSTKTLKGKICEDIEPNGILFLKEEYRFHLERLQNEIEVIQPKIVVAIGRTSAWSLTGINKLSGNIGKIFDISGPIKHEAKCLIIYHPSYMLRNRNLIEDWKKTLSVIKDYY